MAQMTFEEALDHLPMQLWCQSFPRAEHCSKDAARKRVWNSSSGLFIRHFCKSIREKQQSVFGQRGCLWELMQKFQKHALLTRQAFSWGSSQHSNEVRVDAWVYFPWLSPVLSLNTVGKNTSSVVPWAISVNAKPPETTLRCYWTQENTNSKTSTLPFMQEDRNTRQGLKQHGQRCAPLRIPTSV